jgi:superfamily I DNA/RNA helicase
MTKVWSTYQQAIFDFVADHGAGNAIVEAVAGSGKTTTIVEAIKLVNGSAIFLAFNKSIAEELKLRGVNARTFHSLTYSPVMGARFQKNAVMDKLRKLAKDNWSDLHVKQYSAFACKLVGLARNVGIGCLVEDTLQAWIDICVHHDIAPEKGDIETALRMSRELLALSNNSSWVDFDDMLYFAVKDNLALPKYDNVFVDEAQDTNPIQRAILKKILRPGGRLIAVGDPAQAIYGFRGADSEALGILAEEFHCTRLPLSISYRCPTAVVKYARNWVSHIEAAPDAPAGTMSELGTDWNVNMFGEDNLVVCRKTAPLIKLVYQCIKGGKRAYVMGKEIGQGLTSLVKQMNVTDIDQLEVRLAAYLRREYDKLMASDNEDKAEALQDKVGSLQFIISILGEDRRTMEALSASIEFMFAAKDNAVRLATIHKSKGLEADTVFWLDRSSCPSKWAKQEWQMQQEDNLCYVATTRARKALYTIELQTSDE